MPGKKIGGKLSAYLRRKQESRPPNPPNPSNTYEPLSDAHAAYLKDLVKRAGKRMERVKFSVRPNMDTN